jgi:hypothetical protein
MHRASAVPATLLAFVSLAGLLAACSSDSTPAGCHKASDCGAGQVCLSGTCADANPDGGALCTPPSTGATWHLINGGTIGPSSAPASCQRPVGTSSLAAGQVQALGSHQVGTQVSFHVPAGTGTISVVQQLVGTSVDAISYTNGSHTTEVPNTVVPLYLNDASGGTVYDDTVNPPSDPTSARSWYSGSSPSTGVMTLPNTSKALHESSSGGYASGSWQLTVGDYAYECPHTQGCSGGTGASHYDVTVITKPLTPTTGTVDIGIYLVTSTTTASKALTDPAVGRFLGTLSTLYARAGLCLGNITFYDAPAWAKSRFATGVSADQTGPCSELDQMFTLAQAGSSLNFFFVDSISQGSGGGLGSVVGLDGTIPGPSSVGGTIHSGAVVNASDLGAGQPLQAACGPALNFRGCGADTVAYITAHEGGHWMGLYHTTEAPGSFYDPISDTPICDCKSCAGTQASNCLDPSSSSAPPTSPTQLDGTMCTQTATKANCGGGDNLMFWLLGSSSLGIISDEQGQIVRANPVVQ